MTTIRESSFALTPAGRQSHQGRWLALAVLCVSLLIVTLDNTVLNVLLPTLVRGLQATNTQLHWIVDSYVMVFSWLILFAAGSTWAAFSGSAGVLIAARASMGIGGALIMTARNRDVGGYQRARDRARAHHRRAAARALLVGLGLPDQRAHRRDRPGIRDPARA